MKSLIATTILLILFLLNFEATAQSGWFPQTSGTAQHLDDVFFVNSSTGWIAGDYGLILKTTNSGMNWFQQISNAGNKLFSVQFINENTGWASGYAATMRKTTNAGENWLTQSIGPAWLPWKHHFVDENHGWVACEFGIIVHTTNGGADWLTQESGTAEDLYSVRFADINTGWVVGEGGLILKTTNGGTNWVVQPSGTGYRLKSIFFLNNSVGWTVGYGGTILKTTNGGTNWMPQTSGTFQWLWSVYFEDFNTGFAVGNAGVILNTTNGGGNWTLQQCGTSELVWSVNFIDSKTGWAVATHGTILKTTTGGVFYPQTCNITGPDTVFTGPQVLFISNGASGIWSLDNSGGTSAAIISDPDNDSVRVDPGSLNGQFSLLYRASDSDYCSKLVRVIAPVYLNYSTMYNSGHLFADTRFGYSVNSAGDFNGDGFDDLVMGTPWTGGTLCWAGIYYGPPSGGASPDVQFMGEIPYFGSSVSHAGDVNADGYDDVVIGSYGDQNTKGRAYVFLGNPSGIQNRIVMEGEYNGDGFGYSVCKAGDVNFDGFDDVIISAGNEKVFIYLGGQQMDNVPDVTLEGEEGGSAFGRSVSYAGDVNGDGFSDVVVGAPRYLNNTGRAYVYFGGRQMDNVPDVVMTGAAVGFDIMLGYYVGSAGDIDNDGFMDIVIGEGDEQHSFYRIEIFKGGQIMDNIPDVGINTLVNGESNASVFLNNDFNGDGFSDLLAGAPLYNSNEGRAYMYLGSSNMDRRPDYIMNSNGGGRFGFSASIAGDLNSDGYLDAIIGAPYWGGQEWGAAYVYNGFGDPDRTLAGLSLSTSPFSVTAEGYTVDAMATVTNLNSQPLSGVRVNFFSRGINNSYFSNYTDLSGNATFQIGSNSPGIAKLISVSGRYSDTSYIIWASSDVCISGPSDVLKNTTNLFVYEHQSDVRFELLNDTASQARIVSDSNNDSVYVESGNVGGGRFAISVLSGDEVLCVKVIYVDVPLPVNMSALTSSVEGKSVKLHWYTSSELNNSGFEIQRAIENGKWKVENGKWDKIGFVNGKGTTNEPKEYSFTDRNLETGKYKYRLKQLDFNGNFEYFELAEAVSIGIPDKYDLSQNYPNPFNPVTTINYDLPGDGFVTLKVYDMLGREVKTLVNEMKTAGYHKIQFNAADLASGAYFYRMTVGEFDAVKKFVVLK